MALSDAAEKVKLKSANQEEVCVQLPAQQFACCKIWSLS